MIKLGVNFKSSNSRKGALTENYVAKYLRSIGYKVEVCRLSGYDLLATNKITGEVLKIEVKFSSRNNDGKYRATTIKRDATDHRKSDFIIFVCQNILDGGNCTEFIIPCKDQGDKTFLCVTSNPVTYNGKLSVYKNAWHLLTA